MGRMGAEAMANQEISIEAAMDWHLGSNHYPPRTIMADACIAAIKAVNEEDDWDAAIELPEGVQTQAGKSTTTASSLVEAFHLDPWIAGEED